MCRLSPLAAISILSVALATFAQAGEPREWKDAKGRTTRAEFLTLTEDSIVVLRMKDGRIRGLALNKLSRSDQQVAKKLNQSEASDANIRFPRGMDSATKNGIRNSILNLFSAEVEQRKSAALDKVLNGEVYAIKLKVGDPMSGQTTLDEISVKTNKGVVSLPKTHTDQALPEFVKLLNSDFKLKTQDNAEVFEMALDSLYPMSKFSFGNKKEPKEIRHDGNTWQFIRGNFFKKLKGFVVTTANDGSIRKIDYTLEIE